MFDIPVEAFCRAKWLPFLIHFSVSFDEISTVVTSPLVPLCC